MAQVDMNANKYKNKSRSYRTTPTGPNVVNSLPRQESRGGNAGAGSVLKGNDRGKGIG